MLATCIVRHLWTWNTDAPVFNAIFAGGKVEHVGLFSLNSREPGVCSTRFEVKDVAFDEEHRGLDAHDFRGADRPRRIRQVGRFCRRKTYPLVAHSKLDSQVSGEILVNRLWDTEQRKTGH